MSNRPQIQLPCLLLDDRNEHRLPSGSGHLARLNVSVSEEQLRSMKICDFLLYAQKTQRLVCNTGDCPACRRLGQIIVKSAYLIRYPIENVTIKTYQDILDLKSNALDTVRFMESHSPIAEYTLKDQSTVVLECTFDGTPDPLLVPSTTLKRAGSPIAGSHKRPKLSMFLSPPPQHGIFFIPAKENSTQPVRLLPPSFKFPHYLSHEGAPLLDKSRFVPPAMQLIEFNSYLSLILPPGSGKTTYLSMLSTWADCKTSDSVNKTVFEKLQIKQELWNPVTDKPTGAEKGRREYLAMCFDFADMAGGADDEYSVAGRVQTYLRDTMVLFAEKYSNELGDIRDKLARISLTYPETPSLKMIHLILDAAAVRQKKILIIVDHWDFPILRSLPVLGSDEARSGIFIPRMMAFVQHIVEGNKKVSTQKLATLLISGNIPYVHFDSKPRFHNLAMTKRMDGAFGVAAQELQGIYNILRACTAQPELELSQEHFDLGFFTPLAPKPSSSGASFLPQGFFNFCTVLGYLDYKFELGGAHVANQSNSYLPVIARRCPRLLEYSSLRCGRQVTITPFEEISVKSLFSESFWRHDRNLWKLLYYLGGLKATPSEQGPDMVWNLSIPSKAARRLLFGHLRKVPTSWVEESRRERVLRALLECCPGPFTDTLTTFMSYTPLLGFDKMTEAVFQAIVDTYMYEADGTQDSDDTYIDKYFTQLGIITTGRKTQASSSESPAFGQKPGGSSKAAGKQPGGSSKAAGKQPERGPYMASRKPPAASFEVAGASSSKKAQSEYGYADSFLCNLRVHPRRVLVIELKYVSLWAILRAKYKSERDCNNALLNTKDDPTKFRRSCLAEILRIEKMSLQDLRALDFFYWKKNDSGGPALGVSTTVGDREKDGISQLRSYLDAVILGKLTPVEKARIFWSGVSDPKEADEVIGLVVTGVGRRVITTQVEPTVDIFQPQEELPSGVKGYRFKGKKGWVGTFERLVENYQ
ncbi:hypothetical protein GGX14DRAFT_567853 [Mycena pura]|uniref:AAA-ATPase-like domain-containing protein n=1 Tax=Mycena pura TaxID=153505 RepID=A0AAD6Y9C5_9AGAR|nr:hypothetical protein GGX14DRAFT_567853 [Mycena pura]